MNIRYTITVVFLIICQSANCEFLYLGRSREGLLMGDAYTAVAEDESVLFYNPAALGRNDQMQVFTLTPKFELPDLVDVTVNLDETKLSYDKELFNDFPTEAAEMADALLGIPIYIQASLGPTIKIKQFALTFFANSKFHMSLENIIHPELDIEYRSDRGFIVGQALTFGSGGMGVGGHKLSLGVAIKKINRKSTKGVYALMSPDILQLLNDRSNNNTDGLLDALGYSKGEGTGYDVGIESNHYLSGSSRFTLGFSALDIGDTKFEKTEGEADLLPQELSLNLGTSWHQRFSYLSYTLSADYSNMADPMTPSASKFKLGMKMQTPIIDIYMGWNGGYMSWGLGFEMPLIKVQAGFYGVEIGHKFKAKPAKRILLAVDLMSFGSI